MQSEKVRVERLMPGGIPRHIRCYDNGGETDRYTVVFTNVGRFCPELRGGALYLGMSTHPFHPQGFGQHGESRDQIDRPKYAHLGKKIRYVDLPPDCRKLVRTDYVAYWELPTELIYSDVEDNNAQVA